MKEIMHNLKLINTNFRRPKWSDPIIRSSVYQGDDGPSFGQFGCSYEYVLSAELGITFTANSAELPHAVERAKKQLMSRLFGQAKILVGEIRSAAWDEDKDRILDLCRILDDCFSVPK